MMLRTLTSLMLTVVIAASFVIGLPAGAAQPIVTDSRIKTLVYSPNDVFSITTHYGYQSNIEFGEKETIETISMGDRVAWQVSPAGRRLFIRAQEENAHTNMTVVTNLRAYQFDLRSSSADAVFGSEELTYVVRFYYTEPGEVMAPVATYMPPTAPVAVAAPTVAPVAPTSAYNYRYTYSGSTAIAPLKIYDDGISTYFKFQGNTMPRIAVMTARGEMVDIASQRTADGLISVKAIAPRFRVTDGREQLIVYNEAGGTF